MLQNAPEQRQIGFDAANKVFIQGAPHAGNGGWPVRSVGDQLGQHRIVVQRHCPTLINAAIFTHAGTGGAQKLGDLAR